MGLKRTSSKKLDTTETLFYYLTMDNNTEKAAMKEMSAALASCQDVALIEEFLHSLLTENEIKEVASRWALVRLIDKGVSQRKISSELGLSLCKITRGSKELKKENSPFKQMMEISGSSESP